MKISELREIQRGDFIAYVMARRVEMRFGMGLYAADDLTRVELRLLNLAIDEIEAAASGSQDDVASDDRAIDAAELLAEENKVNRATAFTRRTV